MFLFKEVRILRVGFLYRTRRGVGPRLCSYVHKRKSRRGDIGAERETPPPRIQINCH